MQINVAFLYSDTYASKAISVEVNWYRDGNCWLITLQASTLTLEMIACALNVISETDDHICNEVPFCANTAMGTKSNHPSNRLNTISHSNIQTPKLNTQCADGIRHGRWNLWANGLNFALIEARGRNFHACRLPRRFAPPLQSEGEFNTYRWVAIRAGIIV